MLIKNKKNKNNNNNLGHTARMLRTVMMFHHVAHNYVREYRFHPTKHRPTGLRSIHLYDLNGNCDCKFEKLD